MTPRRALPALIVALGLSSGACRLLFDSGTDVARIVGRGSRGAAPILVAAHPANRFGLYLAEILRAEGFNECEVTATSSLTPAILVQHEVLVLGEGPLVPDQVQMLTEWVMRGGNLIAMRPDKQLSGLLGLTDVSTTLSDAYLRVDTSTAPGAGIVDETMQFHGTATGFALDGATAVAMLYSDRATATPFPALTLRAVGADGGQAAAFTYDLARSVVYTRQGNPAWAGQKRGAHADPLTQEVVRTSDLFFGAAPFDPQPDWIDLSKVAIPQADEQQRLLANLILHMNRERMPLPRFWYFPRMHKAVIIMTGDDHGGGGTSARFDQYRAVSPVGCSVADWECVRSSSFIYPSTLSTPGTPSKRLSEAQAVAYTNAGFEVGVHISTNAHFGACAGADWTPASLERFYDGQLRDWSEKYARVPPPSSNRVHCSSWTDYVTQAKVELNHGMRLDLNYYYWPPAWVLDRPGFFTGSGIPMRFADVDGTIIDVYQAPTQMTDESGQSYPFTVQALLDRALGPHGYYGAFVANAHTDFPISLESNSIINAARRRKVPIVSGHQMLQWLDGRRASSFSSLEWNGESLRFTINTASGANGLQAMLPATRPRGVLTSISRSGSPVAYRTETVKGVSYALFAALNGRYQATYAAQP